MSQDRQKIESCQSRKCDRAHWRIAPQESAEILDQILQCPSKMSPAFELSFVLSVKVASQQTPVPMLVRQTWHSILKRGYSHLRKIEPNLLWIMA